MNKFLAGLVILLTSFVVNAATTKEVATKTTNTNGTVNVTLTKDNVLVMNDYFEDETVASLAQKPKSWIQN